MTVSIDQYNISHPQPHLDTVPEINMTSRLRDHFVKQLTAHLKAQQIRHHLDFSLAISHPKAYEAAIFLMHLIFEFALKKGYKCNLTALRVTEAIDSAVSNWQVEGVIKHRTDPPSRESLQITMHNGPQVIEPFRIGKMRRLAKLDATHFHGYR